MDASDSDNEDLFECTINKDTYSILGSRRIVLRLGGYGSFRECWFWIWIRGSGNLEVLNGDVMSNSSSRRTGFIVCSRLSEFCSRSCCIRSQIL